MLVLSSRPFRSVKCIKVRFVLQLIQLMEKRSFVFVTPVKKNNDCVINLLALLTRTCVGYLFYSY